MKSFEFAQWRTKNYYTRIRLGKSLGVTTITVYRWEKGTSDMPLFLYLALKYLELKGDEIGPEDKRKIKGRKKNSSVGWTPPTLQG